VNVFDASALLVYLGGESGADQVRGALEQGGVVSAANWSEVAQKVRAAGADWDVARGLLLGYALVVEPVTREDAERAAARWRAGVGLSLADRLCLALGDRLGADVWTADAAWASEDRVQLIRSGG
jgi:PIN domain nuclease of toxin-antitoxin system